MWSLHVSEITHHTDLHPSRNVYLKSWFILSVLFLTGGETSVVPNHFQDPPSRRPLLQLQCLPSLLVHIVCIVFNRWWDICGP